LGWGSATPGPAAHQDYPVRGHGVARVAPSAQTRAMISHISLGVRDLEVAQAFYDAALAPLGYARLWRTPHGAGYGPPNPRADEKLALFFKPDSSAPLAAGPGFHLALIAPSSAAVDAFHAAAIAHGGRDDGAPGLRPHYGATYYAAFVFDPDGHKLEAKRE
jgi:catechol 2,3-dioxygenase-like lactoylglutathione lyase family enzyme